MAEGIIGLVSCILCALPFFIIGQFGRRSSTPVTFWAGDRTLQEKVTDLEGYNAGMSRLYKKSGAAFLLAGACFLVSFTAGMILLSAVCTAGFYWMYRKYKQILREFSKTQD